MKFIHRFVNLTLFSGALLFTQVAYAYLQLTYNSNPLHFIQGYLGGDPYDDIGSDDPPYPSFIAAFDKIDKVNSPQPINTAVNVSIIEWPELLEDIPVTGGSITLGESGIPVAWNFSMQLTKSTPGYSNGDLTLDDEYELPTKTSWWFESSHGENTCNCDSYRYDDDIYIQRAHYSWAYANTIGFLFGGENSSDNWSAIKIDVPEPKAYLLLVLGLIVVGVKKMRNREII